jgi:hypothetical protein
MRSVNDLQKWAINKSAGFLTALDKILESIMEERSSPGINKIISICNCNFKRWKQRRVCCILPAFLFKVL